MAAQGSKRARYWVLVVKAMSRTGIASYLPYSIGQSSHRAAQIQREEKDTHLYGKSIKEFVAIFNLPYTFTPQLVLINVFLRDDFL